MSDPFLGEIKMWMMPWAPQGWALCNGNLLPIAQNQALNALLGKQFGGDGVTNFGLPDFRGRTPIGTNGGSTTRVTSAHPSYATGASGGAEQVSLSPSQVPPHVHSMVVDSAVGNVIPPTGAYLAAVNTSSAGAINFNAYMSGPTSASALCSGTISPFGGGGGHPNMQPFLVVNFTICTIGIYPPRP